MDRSEPTMEEIRLLSRLVEALDCFDDGAVEAIRLQLGWPLPRLMYVLRRYGFIDRVEPLPLP